MRRKEISCSVVDKSGFSGNIHLDATGKVCCMATITIRFFERDRISERAVEVASTAREVLEPVIEDFERSVALVESVWDGAICLYQSAITAAEGAGL